LVGASHGRPCARLRVVRIHGAARSSLTSDSHPVGSESSRAKSISPAFCNALKRLDLFGLIKSGPVNAVRDRDGNLRQRPPPCCLRSQWAGSQSPLNAKGILVRTTLPFGLATQNWRREWDSNPQYGSDLDLRQSTPMYRGAYISITFCHADAMQIILFCMADFMMCQLRPLLRYFWRARKDSNS
jgi:hypothetical protein